MQAWALIVDTLRESIDKKLFWINLLLSLFLASAVACIGFDDQGIELFFGWYRMPNAPLSTAHPDYRAIIGMILNHLFVDWYVGWIVCLLGLVATAGIFPSLTERGTIDSVLARPLSRWSLFFAKYVGGLFFIAIQSAVFVVLLFVVVGWRWKEWFPGLLWAVPLIILLFSYLFCMCVAFGIWTRSAMASFLLTVAVWFLVIFAAQTAYEYTQGDLRMSQWQRLRTATAVVRWLLPKTGDIPRLMKGLTGTDELEIIEQGLDDERLMTVEEKRYLMAHERRMLEIPWYYSVGSSLLFEAVVLLLAAWRFSRKDF